MNRTFIDTNIFLRYITNDVPEKANISEYLVNKAQQGEILLFTNSIVIAEIVWVLKSFYGYSKEKIDEIVSPIVASGTMNIQDRQIVLQALENFHYLNIDYSDAYIAAWMQENGLSKIITLNVKDFNRLPGIQVLPLPYF